MKKPFKKHGVIMTACSKCRKSIAFDGKVKSSSGKYIPLDVATMKPHECNERFIAECKRCKTKITFENDFKNDNGKAIPINAFDGIPHDCSRTKTGLDEFFWR